MKFYQFAQALYPYYTKKETQKDFIVLIFDKIALYEDENGINPIYDTNPKTVTRLFSDEERGIPKNLAINIHQHICKSQFEGFLEESLNEDLYSDLCKDFSSFIPDITEDNLFQKITDEFCLIIENESKKQKAKSTKKSEQVSSLSIESQLSVILNKISSYRPEEAPSLNYSPVSVHEKLSDVPMLETMVQAFAAKYYPVLDELVIKKTSTGQIDSKAICDVMKNKYLQLKKMKKDKQTIFNDIAFYIQSLSSMDELACKIVVSFFIQKCEVFDAITR